MATPMSEGTVPWPEADAKRYVAAGYWAGRPLGDLLREVADRTPDATALVDGPVRLTFAELADRVDAAAGRLLGLGLAAGDRIVVQLANGWEFTVLTCACLRAGIVPVMALPAHRRAELAYLAAHSEAAAIAVPDRLRGFDHQALAHELAKEATARGTSWWPGTRSPRQHRPSAALRPRRGSRGRPGALRDRPPGSRDVALFLLSGGTTGLPKLIARTHDDYAYNARASAAMCGFDAGHRLPRDASPPGTTSRSPAPASSARCRRRPGRSCCPRPEPGGGVRGDRAPSR